MPITVVPRAAGPGVGKGASTVDETALIRCVTQQKQAFRTPHLLAPCSSRMTAELASPCFASLTALQVKGTPREDRSSAARIIDASDSSW